MLDKHLKLLLCIASVCFNERDRLCVREREREREREGMSRKNFDVEKSVNGDLQLRALERSNLHELEEKKIGN